MMSLVMPRDGWHPPVMRTVASENKGITELAENDAKFQKHFAASRERQRKHREHWKSGWSSCWNRACWSARWAGRAREAAGGTCPEMAERKKDPFTAVNEILRKADWPTEVATCNIHGKKMAAKKTKK